MLTRLGRGGAARLWRSESIAAELKCSARAESCASSCAREVEERQATQVRRSPAPALAAPAPDARVLSLVVQRRADVR